MNHIFTFTRRGMAVMIAGASLLAAASCSNKNTESHEVGKTYTDVARGVKGPNYRMPADMSALRPDLARNLAKVFNDSNRYQYAHAQHIGIEPIHTLQDAYLARRPLVKIGENTYYRLDSLTHSLPYLVPEAATLLHDIGVAFRDSLVKQKLPLARLRVTSVLRTPATVKKLRRVNRNATDSSTHQFATTFDLAYNNFYAAGSDDKVAHPRYREVLGEVLYDLRARHRCMVKYERKSPCFHVTAIQ